MHISNTNRAEKVVALPGQLFYSTQIPVGLGCLAKNKHDDSVVVNEMALVA